MRDKHCRYAGYNRDSTPGSACYHNRCNNGLPGFIQHLQHSSCFRSNLLYMDVAFRLDRKFHFHINNGDSRYIRRDNIGYSQ